jgi:hypothetical protein
LQNLKNNHQIAILAEIYYEVDEFNKLYLEKIAEYTSNIPWYPKRKIGCNKTLAPLKAISSQISSAIVLIGLFEGFLI